MVQVVKLPRFSKMVKNGFSTKKKSRKWQKLWLLGGKRYFEPGSKNKIFAKISEIESFTKNAVSVKIYGISKRYEFY